MAPATLHSTPALLRFETIINEVERENERLRVEIEELRRVNARLTEKLQAESKQRGVAEERSRRLTATLRLQERGGT